jgi:hypothetical protein
MALALVALVVTVQVLAVKTLAVEHLLSLRCQWLRERLTLWLSVVVAVVAQVLTVLIQYLAQSLHRGAVPVLILVLTARRAVLAVAVDAVPMLAARARQVKDLRAVMRPLVQAVAVVVQVPLGKQVRAEQAEPVGMGLRRQ